MAVISEEFGRTKEGKRITRYVIRNSSGMGVNIITMGASIQSLLIRDKNGILRDIVPGYEHGEAYNDNIPHFGSTIGRCCNRIRNGRFVLNGREYHLSKNKGENHLHGGFLGFDQKNWKGRIVDDNSVELSCESIHGEEGYPGNLKVRLRFSFTEDNNLLLNYNAVSDRDTLCNLTNRVYFNLAGHSGGDVVEHWVRIGSATYIEMGQDMLPTGRLLPVKTSEYDFRNWRRVRKEGEAEVKPKSGCFLLPEKRMGWVAEAWEESSGIWMGVETTLPALQYYTGYLVKEETGCKDNAFYGPFCGLCFESQYVTDAINHSGFTSPILRARKQWKQMTRYCFGSFDSLLEIRNFDFG